MNFLQNLYPGDVMASFVIRVLAEITLVTAIAFVLARMIARKNPALRHGICVCALLFVVAAPLTTLGLEQLGWRTFSIQLESEKQSLTTVAIPYGEKVVPVVSPAAKTFWTLERARDVASLIILIWALGTGVLLFRLVNGSRKVRALRRSAREIDDPKLQAALASVGVQTQAPIRFSKRLHSPVVVGPRDTTVILPEKLLAQLDEDQLRSVLAHELTHVRQRDPLIGLIQRFVEAGYWPHPMVHVLNRDLVRAREEVCDNAALCGSSAPRYADTLLTVALGMSPQHATFGIGLMTKKWRLEERVKGLLDPQRRLTTTMNTRHLAFVLVALAAGTAIIAGAHVVAAPNPPILRQQQSLDLYSHYNPKTGKVSVTSKLTQVKTAKKVKVARSGDAKTYVITDTAKGWTVLPKGQKVRVRYAPADTNVLKVSPKLQSMKVKDQNGKWYVTTGTDRSDTVLLGKVELAKDSQLLQVSADDLKSTNVTLSNTKVGDTLSYTLQSDYSKDKGTNLPVVVTTTTTKDGKIESVLTTTQFEAVVTNKDQGKGELSDVNVTLAKPAQLSDTIALTPQSKTITITPQIQLDTKESPLARVYYIQQDRPVLAMPKFQVGLALPKAYRLKSDTHYKPYIYRVAPKSTQTTVYIDGDHIRVVGDNIKVVHVDSKAKKVVKPKGK